MGRALSESARARATAERESAGDQSVRPSEGFLFLGPFYSSRSPVLLFFSTEAFALFCHLPFPPSYPDQFSIVIPLLIRRCPSGVACLYGSDDPE